MEPLAAAALAIIKQSHEALRRAVDKASVEAVNWQPASTTNSVCVLVHHALNSERGWLALAVGDNLQGDREADFRRGGDDPSALAQRIEEADGEASNYLQRFSAGDLVRQVQRGNLQVSGAWAVLHAVEHVREHLGHIELTLQFWEQQATR